jgi:hypothetical protein
MLQKHDGLELATAILHITLAFVLICCKYKSVFAKLIILQISEWMFINYVLGFLTFHSIEETIQNNHI